MMPTPMMAQGEQTWSLRYEATTDVKTPDVGFFWKARTSATQGWDLEFISRNSCGFPGAHPLFGASTKTAIIRHLSLVVQLIGCGSFELLSNSKIILLPEHS